MLAAVGATAVAQTAPPGAADPVRGKALYESRCQGCHEASVHRRESRLAKDYDQLRRQVERWSSNSGAAWRTDEVESVAAYLNERYYKYPCTGASCPTPARASLQRPGLTAAR